MRFGVCRIDVTCWESAWTRSYMERRRKAKASIKRTCFVDLVCVVAGAARLGSGCDLGWVEGKGGASRLRAISSSSFREGRYGCRCVTWVMLFAVGRYIT